MCSNPRSRTAIGFASRSMTARPSILPIATFLRTFAQQLEDARKLSLAFAPTPFGWVPGLTTPASSPINGWATKVIWRWKWRANSWSRFRMRRSRPKSGNGCGLASPRPICTCSTPAHRRLYRTGWRRHEFRRPRRKRAVSPMTRDILIGIDAGTSVIKAVAFSLAGEQIAVAARPNVYQTLGGGQVEQAMHRTWADCAATLRELTERVPDLSRRAAALAVTAQGDGSWLIDADGEPVGGG